MPANKNPSFSKEFRKQVVTITAQRLARDVFNADGYHKPLCEARWHEYRTLLIDAERVIAVEAFSTRMKELNNGQSGCSS